MKNCKVSIITVCLNSGATVRQTIESVLHQTYRDIEYIIIDGGSADGTLDIIQEYVPQFCGRMKYVSEKDQGIYDAMNKGINLAAGDVIGIINSDDWYELDAVERVAKCFEETEAEAVYGEMWLIDQNEEREYHTCHSAFPPHPGTFIRREVYQKHGLFDLHYKIASDRDLLLRFMAEGVRFTSIDAILVNFRRTGISNIRILECAEETYEIDWKYFGRCPECMDRDAIEEKYEREKLLYISQNQPLIVRRIFEGKNLDQDGIVIFGVGNCGKEIATILKKCSVLVHLFVDNDMSKWGLEYQGIKIYSPEILRSFKGHVIITVTRFQQDICRQLQGYENPSLSWSVLGEMRKRAICDYGNLS